MANETSFCYSYTCKNIKALSTTTKTFQQPHLQDGYQHLEESPGNRSGAFLISRNRMAVGRRQGRRWTQVGFTKSWKQEPKVDVFCIIFKANFRVPDKGLSVPLWTVSKMTVSSTFLLSQEKLCETKQIMMPLHMKKFINTVIISFCSCVPF